MTPNTSLVPDSRIFLRLSSALIRSGIFCEERHIPVLLSAAMILLRSILAVQRYGSASQLFSPFCFHGKAGDFRVVSVEEYPSGTVWCFQENM